MVFVTTTVKDWIPVLADEKCAKMFIDTFRDTLVQFQISLTAYVLMPSHFHALLGFNRIEQLSEAMQSIKSISARKIKSLLSDDLLHRFSENGSFQFWRPRFDDLIIWSEEQFKVKMEYIHNNPVKGDMAKESTDYLYSSARDWLSNETGILPVDKDWNWLKEEVN